MPRSLEEIRALAKSGKPAGAAGTPAAMKMPTLQKGHTPANASGRTSGRDTPLQVSKTPVQASWKRVPDDMSSPAPAKQAAAANTHKVEEEEEIASSRASTPETLPEEPPMLGGEGEGDVREFEMTVTHSKILILISKYAQCALTSDDHESWIRQVPLFVLIYEGVIAGSIDLDYAPCSVLLSYEGASRRMFLNMSQEGKSAVEDLREQQLINGLKLSSEDFQPVNSFQVSLKGLQFLKTLPNNLFEEVNGFIYAPNAPHYDTELLEVSFDGDKFWLASRSGFERLSSVHEVEDVSYVSSPFLPESIRTRWGKNLQSNSHRAHESAAGGNINEHEFTNIIDLSYATVLVIEWVPFGANQIVALNYRLGAFDRCQGGLFTALIDKNPTDTNFKLPTGMTSINIIDFDLVRFINFEAEINFPEEEGTVQVEHFGLHVNVDGTVFYGIKVEAIKNSRAEKISIDALSRVLVDVQLDSSKILDDLLTGYQRSLLDVMFLGDAAQRSKYSMLVADAILPKLPAQSYIDRGPNENELKQVLGDIYMAHDIGPDDLIIVGKDGLLLAGPNALILEPLVLYYVSLLSREVFIRNYFMRVFVLVDTLTKIRQLILRYESDPDNVQRIRHAISEASKHLILLQETLDYLEESLVAAKVPSMPQDAKCKRLFRVLNCEMMSNNVRLRVRDLAKLVDGAANQLVNLTQTTDSINSKQLEESFKAIEFNTKYLVDASAANERASASLAIMQVLLAGTFAFDIIDRIGGTTLNIGPPTWCINNIVKPLLMPAGVWFAINMVWMSAICYFLTRLMRYLEMGASGALILRVKLNKKIKNEDGLLAYLSTKIIESTDSVADARSSIKKVLWKEDDAEKWLGAVPKIELTYDDRYMFVLAVTLMVDTKKSNATEEDLLNIFLQDLVMAEALDKSVAFGRVGEQGHVERAMAISKMQAAA